MRLIDAGKFLNNLSGMLKSMEDYDAVRKVINNMPTAYDVDKVVEQLEELKSQVPEELSQLMAYDEAIETVRQVEKMSNIKCDEKCYECGKYTVVEVNGETIKYDCLVANKQVIKKLDEIDSKT